MITIDLKVWDATGKEHFVRDYLLSSALYKVKHFCEAVGLEEHYCRGTLKAEDCLNRSGRLKIGVSKDKTGLYPDKNNVRDYMPDIGDTKQPAPAFDDDIPL